MRYPEGSDSGWSHVLMRWLGRVTQPAEISLCWVIGVLAGGIVLGWLPAGVAAGAVLHRLGSDEPSSRPIADFFASWRGNFVRANAVGWPATVALAILAVNLWILSRGGQGWMPIVFALTVAVAVWLVLGVGYLMSLLAQDDVASRSATELWRTSMTMPLISPATTLVWAVCILSVGLIAWAVPPVGIVFGPAAVAWMTAWLTRRRLAQTGVAPDLE